MRVEEFGSFGGVFLLKKRRSLRQTWHESQLVEGTRVCPEGEVEGEAIFYSIEV